MAQRPTPAQQEKAVGEGLAAGCVAIHFFEFTANKMVVDLAFIVAWRNWAWSSYFPSIKVTHSRNNLLHILRKSTGRRSRVAEWKCGRKYEPVILGDFNEYDVGDFVEEDANFPLEGWIALASSIKKEIQGDSFGP